MSHARLLVTIQAVDLDDPLMGFFHEWLEEAAKQFETITVLALRVGRYALPSNVIVIPLRPHGSRSRVQVIATLWRESWRRRRAHDAVFVRGDAQYVLVAGLLWRLLGKRVVLWYAHYVVNPLMIPASWIAHAIVTSVPEACAHPWVHPVCIGQAISPERFVVRDKRSESSLVRCVILGRVMRIKRVKELVETFIEADRHTRENLDIIGPRPEKEYQRELETLIASSGHHARLLPDTLAYDALPTQLRTYDVLLNAYQASLDKSIVESMLCGLIPIVATDGLRHCLPESLHWLIAKDQTSRLTTLRKIFSMTEEERYGLGEQLRGIAIQHHSIMSQIMRVKELCHLD